MARQFLAFAIFLLAPLGITHGLVPPVAVVPPAVVTEPSSSPYILELRRESVPVKRKGVVVSHKTTYSGLISVGRPAQEFRVVFDTGSGHVVLPSVECKSESCLVHRRYNMSASSSGVGILSNGKPIPDGDLADQVTIGYGTGQVVGQFVKEEVCVGPPRDPDAIVEKGHAQPCEPTHVVMAVEMSKQPFKNFGFDGILGLGLSSLALTNKFSFFDRFAYGGRASSPHFGVFLTDGEDGDSSEIAFGGLNPKKLLGELSWEPVINPDLGYWQLELLAVRVDGQTLSVCEDGSCRAVMDTGTSHLGIPGPHDKTLGSALLQPAADLTDCRRVKGPVLEFQFHNFTMTLHPEDYMRPLPLQKGVQVGSVKGVTLEEGEAKPLPTVVDDSEGAEPEMQCRPRLMPVNLPAPLGPKLFILGEPVLHRYYTVFDWKRPQIGFGLASKGRYADPIKMRESGQELRADVKAVLSLPSGTAQSPSAAALSAGLNDEVLLVQVTLTYRIRRKSL